MATIKLRIKDWDIEVLDDETYTPGSQDNKYFYQKEYGFVKASQPISKQGILVKNGEEVISSAVLLGYEGATHVDYSSVAIDEDKILLCVSDTVFCLSIPTLSLEWSVKADNATCFEIYSREEGYFVHGEFSISKLSKSGDVEWQFFGRDIFVSPDGKNEFQIHDNRITIRDWERLSYTLDLNGHEIHEKT